MLNKISADLELLMFSPKAVLESLDKGKPADEVGPSLLRDGCGTFFFVRPYDSVLDADLAEDAETAASPLEKFLIGFGNTMLPDIPHPPIKAAFRQHRPDGEFVISLANELSSLQTNFVQLIKLSKDVLMSMVNFEVRLKYLIVHPFPIRLIGPEQKVLMHFAANSISDSVISKDFNISRFYPKRNGQEWTQN